MLDSIVSIFFLSLSNFLFEKAMGGIKGLPASALFKANGDYVQGYIGLVPEEMLENDINRATK